MEASIPDHRRNTFLDVVRGCAILGVLWQHTFADTFPTGRLAVTLGAHRFYPFVFNNGFLGVNVLFIVSGFVLFNPGRIDRFSPWTYYKKRALRLWPLYALVLLFIFTITAGNVPHKAATFVLLLSGVHDLIPTLWATHQLPVLWSLGVEILFSILLPALILSARKVPILKLTLAAVILCFVYRIAADDIFYRFRPDHLAWSVNALKDNIFGRLDDFLVGMSASWLYAKGYRPSRLLALGALVALASAGYAWNVISVTPPSLPIYVLASLADPLFSIPAAILMLYLLPLAAWRSAWLFPLRLMGQCCYSLYLVHSVIISYFGTDFDRTSPLAVPAYFAITFAVSLVLFLTVELWGIGHKPEWVQRLRRSIAGRRKA